MGGSEGSGNLVKHTIAQSYSGKLTRYQACVEFSGTGLSWHMGPFCTNCEPCLRLHMERIQCRNIFMQWPN
ncbi:unnamed protein product [Urochloa humidicola]